MIAPISVIKAFTPPEVFVCNCCRSDHTTRDEAAYCCADIVPQYKCPVCKANHDAPNQAMDCCDYDPLNPPPAPSWELELAGQQRLEGVA